MFVHDIYVVVISCLLILDILFADFKQSYGTY